ncbi:hypothetical protein [Actinoplanes sp. URMC 104]|uniref:hypothetical protein n=1 Tax=Actinoplanes sp. URMC 104 TaxID=3423409 RepID=UPI003F1B047A
MSTNADDTYDSGRLCPDVTTKHPGGHHPECCCFQCYPDDDSIEVPLLDVGGYLACGCHGSQREHTCDNND